MDGTVTLTSCGRIAEILIDRPAKHNALTTSMYKDLSNICREVNADDEIRVAIISGAGDRAFCAGSDLNALSEFEDFWAWRNREDYIANILSIRKPCIAATKGWALGGGLEIALACDLRVAADSTVFSAPEVTLGWAGAGGAAQHLTRLAGYGHALRLLLTGDRFTAEEAHALGIVEYLCESGEELAKARQIAESIARHDSIATQSVKAAVRAAMNGSVRDGLRAENDLMALCFARVEVDRLKKAHQNE